ncbi:unnamed protein product [Timema podura]|uniref:Uncharacterized protein n=1 Tax=Timema podura TaxID=61482 RepID=A0ABN7P9V5_TIMPD|nr:unnamed protein product [Timema podura]
MRKIVLPVCEQLLKSINAQHFTARSAPASYHPPVRSVLVLVQNIQHICTKEVRGLECKMWRLPLETVALHEPSEHLEYDSAHRSGLADDSCVEMFPACPVSLLGCLGEYVEKAKGRL